jgi:putative protease
VNQQHKKEMILSRKDIELLAPAGSWESLIAAAQGGADAVYFGIGQLNMRARSSFNFTPEDVPEIVKIAKENGLKTYLTLNTVIYDQELLIMRDLVDLAKKEGVNAIIASDQAVMDYAFKEGVEVHLSTQLNISNIDTLKFYANFADIVVLARELNLDQVAAIARGIELQDIKGPKGEKVKIEMFVHGALCMSISGKCYLSLHEYNHSANRGDCLQACRRSYLVTDTENGNQLEIDNQYIMSPKDLLTIHFLNKVIDSGVRVLKIEGRARSPEYVKTVTSCYNEAVNSIVEGSYSKEKIIHWKQRLETVFNRGFWDGYYLGQKLGEWSEVYGSKASKRKIYCAKVTNYFEKIGVAELLVETGILSVGDALIITGPTSGVLEHVVSEIRIEDKSVSSAEKGIRCSIPFETTIRRGDKVYRKVDSSEISLQ